MAQQNQQLQRVDQQRRDIRELLNRKSTAEEIAKVLPKYLTPDRITRVALTAFIKTPDLLDCTQESLMQCVMICAQAGLEPDGRLAHIIPFGTTAQVIFDYKGLVTLAKRNGVDVKAVLVYERDNFQYIEDDGNGRTVVHHTFKAFEDRGPIVGVYSRALEANKPPDYELMSIKEVEDIRKRSRAGKSGPWQTDFGEMTKKTAIRRHSKRWDLAPEIREAIYKDFDTPPDINTPLPRSKPLFQDKGNPKQVEDKTPPPAPAPPDRVKQVRDMVSKSKVNESELLGFIRDIGLVEDGTWTLEEIEAKSPSAIETLINQWPDIEGRILAAQQAADEAAK